MELWKKILIPLDGSEFSRRALLRAAGILEQPGVSVKLMSVVETDLVRAADVGFQMDPRHQALQDHLLKERDALLERSVAAEAEVRFGDPAAEIVSELQAGEYDLAIMATHGRTALGRVLFGGVALRVLQASPVPVLFFRPLQGPGGNLSAAETSEPARFRKILVPLDGSQAAEEILGVARKVAQTFRSKLYLFRAVPGGNDETGETSRAEDYLKNWQYLLESQDLIAPVEVRTGPAAEQALDLIRERGLDAAALTTHGRTGLARAMYGSVAEKLVRESGVPVLAIRNKSLRARLAPPAGRRPLLRVE